MITFCTSITAPTVKETVIFIKKIPKQIKRIEVRADFITDLDEVGIKTIANSIDCESIFTCRSKKEGGVFSGDEFERTKLLQRAEGHFTFVDVEYETMIMADIHLQKSQLIISYHNLEDTPHYWQLQKMIFNMKEYSPSMIKIACFAKEPYDVTKLYRLMLNKPHEERRVIIGMGEYGKVTRVLGPLLGCDMTFVTTVCPASAPGQYPLEEMVHIYKTMGVEIG